MEKNIYEYDVKIIYPELDINGKIKISALMRYLQQSGSEQLDKIGMTYKELERLGFAFLLSRYDLKIYRLPNYNDSVIIKTWAKYIKNALFYRDYAVYNQDNELLCEIASAWICVDIKNKRIIRPENVNLQFPCVPDRSVSIGEPEKIVIPTEMPLIYETIVRDSSIDFMGHMNNTVYADIICDALPNTSCNIKNLKINFRKECKQGDLVKVYGILMNKIFYVCGDVDGKRSFDAKVELD